MSLLNDDEDDPYDDEDTVLRSHTDDLLFDPKDSSSRGRAKKNERKVRGEEKRGSKPVNWNKYKDSVVQEIAPKKSKGQGQSKSSSVSKTPPDSPKMPRPVEMRLGKGVATGPSPNIKNQRKRYSQLGSESSSEEEGNGLLVPNHPILRSEGVVGTSNPLDEPGTNPFLRGEEERVEQTMPFLDTSGGPLLPTGAAKECEPQQAWVPSAFSTLNLTATHIPSFFPELSFTSSGVQPHPPLLTTSATNPSLLDEETGLFPSLSATNDLVETNPFLPATTHMLTSSTSSLPSSYLATGNFIAPPPPLTNPTSLSSQQPDLKGTPLIPSSAPPPDDWSISEELRSKCLQQFNELRPVNGLLNGDKARDFFVKSKLPNQELSAIWRVSDIDQDNALSQDEFCIAMKLVLMRRKGIEIPTTLPEPLNLLTKRETSKSDIWSNAAPSPTATASSSSAPALIVDVGGEVSPPVHSPSYKPSSDKDELLLNFEDENESSTTSSSSVPKLLPVLQPHMAKINDSTTIMEEEGHNDEESVLVKVVSDSDSDEVRGFKPVRPAPPKPRLPKSRPTPPNKKLLAGKVGDSGEVASPSIASDVRANTKGPPPLKPPRPAPFTVLPKKSSYSALLGSPATESPDKEVRDEVDSGNGYRWKHLMSEGVQSSSADETSEKGHSRSTSLDLNKILLGQSVAGDVFGGVPSAVPPKPPPKLKVATSPMSSLLMGVKEEEEGSGWTLVSSGAEGGEPRKRSLSTGSIASIGGGSSTGTTDDHHVMMDTPTDALLLHQHHKPPPKPPKPKKVPMLPPTNRGQSSAELTTKSNMSEVVAKGTGPTGIKRPPPPSKPNSLAELYQHHPQGGGVESEGGRVGMVVGSEGNNSLVMKDKGELQASIRSLKENNEALIEINKNLEEKLFQLMEERVILARELNLLSIQ